MENKSIKPDWNKIAIDAKISFTIAVIALCTYDKVVKPILVEEMEITKEFSEPQKDNVMT